MTNDIFVSPLASLTGDDIQHLCDVAAEEGPRLEFKRALSTSDGRTPDRWMKDQSGIGTAARDDIAKEVVAFANAYGGVLVIGIDETDEKPPRAKAIFEPRIPQVIDCAERLEMALNSIIDPPISMLEVRGVAGDDGAGVIVIRVPGSMSAPHAFGASAPYVCRGTRSEPMMMRETQSVFYERRTRLERIDKIRDKESSNADQLFHAWRDGRLLLKYENKPLPNALGMLFHLTAAPTEDLQIVNLPDRFKGTKNQRSPSPKIGRAHLISFPTWRNEWERGYRALAWSGGQYNSNWNAEMRADGVITVSYVRGDDRFYPGWFSECIGQVIVLAEWIRRWVGRPDVEYVLQGDFRVLGSPVVFSKHDTWDSIKRIPWSSKTIGPYSIGTRVSIPALFSTIDRDVRDLFGNEVHEPLNVNWATVFEVGL
jgi:Putative DNA-binding domain